MKNIISLTIVIIFAFANIVFAEVYWTKTFGGTNDDYGRCVKQTSDCGFIIAGYTFSYGAGSCDVWLIKTDILGNKLWDKTFGGSTIDEGFSVQQTSDGGYIVTGYTYSYGAGQSDVWLIKTDSDGNLIWDKTFGGISRDEGYYVLQTNEGDYIITGSTWSYGEGSTDVWLIKTDPDGNLIWDKTFGGTYSDEGYYVQQTSDGGYAITGKMSTYSTGNDVWLIRTDPDGNAICGNNWGGNREQYGTCVQQTSDSGYIITGLRTWGYIIDEDIWLIKTNSNCNKIWDKTFGFGSLNHDYSYSVQQTSDGGYILAGYTISTKSKGSSVFLLKTDTEGNKLWDQNFGGPGMDEGYFMQQTNSGGYIIVGNTSSYGAGGSDVWLIYYHPDSEIFSNLSNFNLLFVFLIILSLSILFLSYKTRKV